MNTKHALTLKGFAALLLGVTVVATSCKKDETPSLESTSAPTEENMSMATTTTTSGSFIFNNPFEATDCFSNMYLEKANTNSITRSSEQKRTGSYSAKFILNKSDADVAGSKRTEAVLEWVTPPKYERWYGMSMFLPSSYITDGAEEQLFQWHSQGTVDLDGVSTNNSPMAMYTKNGRWEFGMKYGGTIDLGVYDKNVWTDWVIHVKFSYESDGLLEIWKNGKLVVQKSGRNNYRELKGHFFKIGVYKYGWAQGYTSTTTSRTLFYDDVKIGNENSSYAAVAPQSGSTTTSSTTPTTTTTSTSTNQTVFAVNAGGSAFTAANGITYQADKSYSGGSTFKTTSSISNTSDDALYQSERYGNFSYNVPVANGTYEVTYRLAEIYNSASGKRRFDVLTEGSETISNLDIYAVAGKNNAYNVVKTVTVSDGTLNIRFRSDIDYAKLSALHIIKK